MSSWQVGDSFYVVRPALPLRGKNAITIGVIERIAAPAVFSGDTTRVEATMRSVFSPPGSPTVSLTLLLDDPARHPPYSDPYYSIPLSPFVLAISI